jgi:hypothetical protein
MQIRFLILGVVAIVGLATTTLASSISASAAEYQLFTIEKGTGWRTGFLNWLQRFKPAPEGVTAGIAGGTELHAYVVPGNFSGIYKLMHIKHAPDRPNNAIGAALDGGTGKILGFSNEGVYVLTWSKPQS